jgi:hypothetical protein
MKVSELKQRLKALSVHAQEFWMSFISWLDEDRRRLIVVSISIFVLVIYFASGKEDKVHYVYEGAKTFTPERVIGNPFKHIADNKIDIVQESEERLRKESVEMRRELGEVKTALESLKEGLVRTPQATEAITENSKQPLVQTQAQPQADNGLAEVQLTNENLAAPPGTVSENEPKASYNPRPQGFKGKPGPYSISFPVAVKREEKPTGIVIPTGSYVKAKVVSGVQVPMGETYPVLLQLDFAFIKPSQRKLDLSGCFIVAKAEGDFSTERLQMSPHSMSCYNSTGLYFKKDKLVGWASDPSDNDFALKGEVNLHQGRLAQTAFAKAIIDGLGQSLERNTKSIGGKGIDDSEPQVILRDGGQKVGGMVADYYLSYLKGLRPTMKAGSGRDAWLVMGTDVELPNGFMSKEESDGNQGGTSTDIFN